MNVGKVQVDGSLVHWSRIEHKYKKGALLLGNGASFAVSPKFAYRSLFEEAKGTSNVASGNHLLTDDEVAVFEELRTENFEAVLSALLVAKLVAEKLSGGNNLSSSFAGTQSSIDIGWLLSHYEGIKSALIQAVKSIHIEWTPDLKDGSLSKIWEFLREFDHVYSTNYDLLTYWSIMVDSNCFRDFFWSQSKEFNTFDTAIYDSTLTKVLYLHGGLHLVHNPLTGQTRKLRNGSQNLLAQFGMLSTNDEVPLFISEGTAEMKLSSIRRSDYLIFSLNRFINNRLPLVILGIL